MRRTVEGARSASLRVNVHTIDGQGEVARGSIAPGKHTVPRTVIVRARAEDGRVGAADAKHDPAAAHGNAKVSCHPSHLRVHKTAAPPPIGDGTAELGRAQLKGDREVQLNRPLDAFERRVAARLEGQFRHEAIAH